jgi:hypothetical protein
VTCKCYTKANKICLDVDVAHVVDGEFFPLLILIMFSALEGLSGVSAAGTHKGTNRERRQDAASLHAASTSTLRANVSRLHRAQART